MRIRNTLLGAIAAAALAAVASSIAIETADAHPGKVDAKGCHRDWRHGGRHCHRPSELRTMRNRRQYVPSSSPASATRRAPARATMGGWVGTGRDADREGTISSAGGRGLGTGGGAPAARGGGSDGGRSIGGGDVGNGRR